MRDERVFDQIRSDPTRSCASAVGEANPAQ
jgi:hypothetical protein